jgi:hypothetical protein
MYEGLGSLLVSFWFPPGWPNRIVVNGRERFLWELEYLNI